MVETPSAGRIPNLKISSEHSNSESEENSLQVSGSLTDFLKKSNEIQAEIQKLSKICEQVSPKHQDLMKSDSVDSVVHWSIINELLDKNGFSRVVLYEDEGLEEIPDLKSTSEVMLEVLADYTSKIKELQSLRQLVKDKDKIGERMRRLEKENHKLKKTLRRSEEPKSKNEILRTIAEQLSIENYQEIPGVIMTMQQVLLTLPNIENFIQKVCDLVAFDARTSDIDDVIVTIQKWKNSYATTEKKLNRILETIEADGENALHRAEAIAHFCNLFQVGNHVKNQVEQVYYFVHEMKVYLAFARKQLGLASDSRVKTVLEEMTKSIMRR